MLSKEHFPNWQRFGQENSSLLWGKKKKNKNKKEEKSLQVTAALGRSGGSGGGQERMWLMCEGNFGFAMSAGGGRQADSR
jgi:hypothetical protein